MQSYKTLLKIYNIWTIRQQHITQGNILYKAWYSKKKTDKGQFEIPDTKPTVCNETCKRRDYKKPGILHKIKLKIIEGGTNFGTPFRLLKPEEPCKAVAIPDLPVPATPIPLPLPTPRPGLQVSILGADTRLGQYIAFLLKKCACLKKLRLYEAREEHNPASDLFGVVDDLCYINTNCLVQGFSGAKHELDRCLQNSDIVLMLDDACIRMNMSYEERFNCQAEMVKQYTDAIVTECPKAFIIVSVTPIDCMVPLIAETLKETGWYDPRKLLGSVAVPEMRASTIASRALSLEPSYIKVPCVGGTEGEALVPLFSKAVDFFDFTKENAEMMVRTIRDAPRMLSDDCGKHAAQLSEAHALARLVNSVAWALLCKDIPRVSGFVATNSTQCIAPTRFMANTVEIGNRGISKNFGLVKMSENEMVLLNLGLAELVKKQELVDDWYLKNRRKTSRLNECEVKLFFPKTYERFHECS